MKKAIRWGGSVLCAVSSQPNTAEIPFSEYNHRVKLFLVLMLFCLSGFSNAIRSLLIEFPSEGEKISVETDGHYNLTDAPGMVRTYYLYKGNEFSVDIPRDDYFALSRSLPSMRRDGSVPTVERTSGGRSQVDRFVMSVAVPGKRGENLVIPKDADFKPTAFFAEGSRKVSKKDVSYSFFDRPPKNWWEQTFVIDVGVNIRPDADTKKDKASQILPVILLQEGPAFRKAAEFSDRLYTAVPRVVFEECIRLGQPIPPDAILFIPIKQLRSTDPDDYARALDNEAALKSELKNVTEMTKKFHKPEYLQVFNSPWNAFREKSKLPKDPNWFVALYRGFCGWARRRLGGE